MTPAINLLDKEKVDYKLHSYHHDVEETHFGEEAAKKLKFNAKQIFKTLLLSLNNDARQLIVAIVPVSDTLDMKKLAKVVNAKKVTLADRLLAQKTTGYLIGGISPLGQKKQLPTVIDVQATQFDTILISAGKRGLDIELSPHILVKLLSAQFADIAHSDTE